MLFQEKDKTDRKKCRLKRMGRLLPLLLLLVFMWAAGAGSVYASTTVSLNPGDTYDFSQKSSYKKYGAFYVDIKKVDKSKEYTEYHLKGQASNAMVRIDPPKGEKIVVYLDGVRLTPNDDAPGIASDRAAIEIGDSGGEVVLFINENGHWSDGLEGNIFHGQGRMPAIRKDNTSTKLTFTSKNKSDVYKLIAKADPDAFRTCAIGCYSKDSGMWSRLYSKTTGNIFFESGYIEAWGSQNFKNGGKLGYDRWDGGAAIGANGYGSVDGITVNGGYIKAIAGDTGCAGIGTSSAVDTGPLLAYPLFCSTAKNITINGGKIEVEHFAEVGSKGATLSGTGASIGGGYRTDVENLVINGGEISNRTSTYRPGTGIGAGEEGDAQIKITGGTIDVMAEYVGIGAHAVHITDADIPVPDPDPPSPGEGDDGEDPEPNDGDNTAWFGDVRLDITGGDIKVDSNKVCLGGGIPESKKAYVEIDGGTLDLNSSGKLTGPVIGPGIPSGKLTRISIRGGVINARRAYNRHNTEEHVAMIGNAHHPDLSEHLNSNSVVNMVEISGGTIKLTEKGENGSTKPGAIGGNQGVNYKRDYTWVAITGGNICASMLDGDKTRPWNALKEADGVQVHLQKITLRPGTQYTDRDAFKVKSGQYIQKDGTEYEYGLKDCYLFKESLAPDPEPQLWFWLPDSVEWGKVETDYNPLYGLNAKVFSGLLLGGLSGSSQFDFYPPIYLNLEASHDNCGSARVLYQDKKLTDFIPVDDSSFSKLIDSYNNELGNGGYPVLDRSGEFRTSGAPNDYISGDGRWIYFDDIDSFNQNLGVSLYAILGNYDLELRFDANIPGNTKSTLSGTMPPAAGYHNDEKVTLPKDAGGNYGFRLNGYAFTGWNTKPDGGGDSFASGEENIPATRFRKSSADPSEVTLYAQWTPIKYKVNYSSADPQLDGISMEYTYDKPEKFAWGDDLQSWGDQRFMLAGWKYNDEIYGRNDELLSFTDFDAGGDPQPRTLEAVWMQQGEIRIKVMVNGKAVRGLENDIKLKDSNSGTPQTEFEEDPDEAGIYRNVCSTPLPDGTYTVSIGSRILDPDEASFTYSRNKAAYVELVSYTTTLNKGSGTHITSVDIDPMDDTDSAGRPYVTAPRGYEISIDAEPFEGFAVGGWTCEGTEPEWDPSAGAQKIKVKGTSVLTPHDRPFGYTVTYEPNAEDAAGEMDPQKFSVGRDQNLKPSGFSRKGYKQGVWDFDGEEPREIYWSTSSSGPGAGFADQEQIRGERPLTWEDGAEVPLYALWSPRKYEITYHDPSGTYPDQSEEHKYDESFRLKTLEDRGNYTLAGWKAGGVSGAPVYPLDEDVKNLCTDEIAGYTLDAVWVEKGSINLTLTKDGKPLTGIASDIIVTDGGGNILKNYFEEEEDAPGRYVYRQAPEKPLPQGTTSIAINGCTIPEDMARFDYYPDSPVSLAYNFYTVEVKAGEGIRSVTPNEGSIVAPEGTGFEIAAVPEDGYQFDHWESSDEGRPAGLDPSKASQTITVDGTVELTAYGKGNSYTVQFDPNDAGYPGAEPATGEMANEEMVYGTAKKLAANRFQKTGYTFYGWNAEPDGSGSYYGNGQKVSDLTTVNGGMVTLYAIWEPLEYTITYIDPYRLCRTKKQTAKYNEEINLIGADDPDWKPEGHELSGWTGEALGSFYAPGAPEKNFCTVNEDGSLSGKVLYSEWADTGTIFVSVALDGQGVGVDPDDIELYDKLHQTTYSGCFLGKTNSPGQYLFDPSEMQEELPEGEYTVSVNHFNSYGIADTRCDLTYGPDQAAIAYLQSNTVSIEAGEHVDAVNVKDPMTGKEGNSVVVMKGEKAIISSSVNEKGYHFSGYTVNGSADMDPLAADQEIRVFSKVSLTAHAAGNEYLIHFAGNGGKGTMADLPLTYGQKSRLAAGMFKREHYDFTGWNTKQDGSGTSYKDRAEVLNLADGQGDTVVLYAQWKKIPVYKVTFVTNGGSRVPDQTVEKGKTAAKPANPKRTGYVFKGWYQDKSLKKPFSFGTGITKNTTVYAKWEKARIIHNFSLTFVTNGGSKVPTQTVQEGKKAVKPADPKLAGYTFGGWYADKALTKAFDFSKAITRNTTVYAKWTADPVPVLMAWGKPSGKRSVNASWTKVSGASKYLVYAGKCGEKLKRVKVTTGNSFKLSKVRGKKLVKHRAYVLCVTALDKNGKVIATSKKFHVITAKTMGNEANITGITANRKQITLKQGKTAKAGARYTLPGGKKHINKKHGRFLRFTSDNPKTANVDKNGTVKAIWPGKATIYIQDTSGIYCRTIVTVVK